MRRGQVHTCLYALFFLSLVTHQKPVFSRSHEVATPSTLQTMWDSIFQLPLARARYYPACPSVGITPSCCILPRSSPLIQASMPFPLEIREMTIAVVVTYLPVGGIPMKSP